MYIDGYLTIISYDIMNWRIWQIGKYFQWIINNYWTRLSKISGFVSGVTTEKSRYFARPSSIIVLSFGHWNVSKTICHLHARATARNRKTWFHLRMGRILFAAKHGWTTLCINRPLFLGSYLQATWWASFRPMKKKKNLHRMIIRHIEFYSLR